MNEADNHSDVARLRRRIALEQEAAQRGLSGLAIVARHEIITARMMRGAERILQLIDEGKHEEAQTLMETESWGIEENEDADGTTSSQGKKAPDRSAQST